MQVYIDIYTDSVGGKMEEKMEDERWVPHPLWPVIFEVANDSHDSFQFP